MLSVSDNEAVSYTHLLSHSTEVDLTTLHDRFQGRRYGFNPPQPGTWLSRSNGGTWFHQMEKCPTILSTLYSLEKRYPTTFPLNVTDLNKQR